MNFGIHHLADFKAIKEIPTYLVAGIFRKNQTFFQILWRLTSKYVGKVLHHLFVQDHSIVQTY
jgi:hypothetical protein